MIRNKREDPRAAALESLLALERDGKYSNLEVSASLNRSRMSEQDKGLYTALVYGVIERSLTLDYIITHYAGRSAASLDADVRVALRLGLYQLLYMDKIPPHAAVSESVDLVEKRAKGFVNAVLRAFLRADCHYDLPPETDTLRYLSVRYGCPEALLSLWMEQYGRDTAEKLAETTIRQAPVAVRVNPLRTDRDTLARRLTEAGETVSFSRFCDDVLLLNSAKIAMSDAFAGDCFVEDEASRLAVKLLGAKPGETVVDTCAAPGGKSFSMALDMQNCGKVYSFDLHKNKLSLVKRGSERLGITILETEARDAREPREDLVGKADRVLCDAPCSGLGVIAKKPEIKFRSMEAVAALPVVQKAVLRGAAAYVRPGGRLVYSTCTLNRAENEDVVLDFLEEYGDFTFAEIDLNIDGCLKTGGGMMQFLPHQMGCDGFFVAVMERKGGSV